MKRKITQEKAITLIALVITIIVLLILAGISIATLVGENGILSKATAGKEKTKQEEGKEIVRLAVEELRIEKLEKGEKLTLDYIGENIHEKLKIEKDDVTKNGEPVESVDVIYGEYVYTIDDKFQVEIGGPIKGRIEINYTYQKVGKEGIITITAKTEDNKGIRRIIKPDGKSQDYYNNEKEVTFEYRVTQNGNYKFVGEGNNDSTRSKTVKIVDLDLFQISFDNRNDFLSVEEAYSKSKESMTDEQSEVISKASNLVPNTTLSYASKGETNDIWTLLGKSNDEVLSDYYLYDRYDVEIKSIYVEGTWSAWSSNFKSGMAGNNRITNSYTLNSSSGTFTVHAPNLSYSYIDVRNGGIFYPYGEGTNVGKSITRWKMIDRAAGIVQSSSMTSVLKEERTIKDFEEQVMAKEGTYPDKDYQNNKYYEKKEQAKSYYLYKYEDNEIKTTYHVGKGIINTKKIDLISSKNRVRILIDASNSNYKLSISSDNTNWHEISNNATLNGETDINLPEEVDSLYLKIEKNDSIINQIVVK